jgi:hypothetical protein
MHPYDGLNRREMIREEAGVGACNITKCCTEVCPEHIHITDNGIIPLKERVADIYFDPVQWLARKLMFSESSKKPSASNFQPVTFFTNGNGETPDVVTAGADGTNGPDGTSGMTGGMRSIAPQKPLPRMEGGPPGVVKSEIEFHPQNPNIARAPGTDKEG